VVVKGLGGRPLYNKTYEALAKVVSGDFRPYSGVISSWNSSWNFGKWNHHSPHSNSKSYSKWDCNSSPQTFASGSYVICFLAGGLLLGMAACVQKPGDISTVAEESQAQQTHVQKTGNADVPFLIQPAKLDLGEVDEGKEATATLFVRNTGWEVLHIANVQSLCGCTVSDLGSREVPPGGFTTLKVRIDTSAKGGAVKKKVTVTDSFGRSADAWLYLRVKENPHARGMHAGKTQGRGIFSGKCAACHAAPAKGKRKGVEIYAAVCVMCHGEKGQGAYAPRLRGKDADDIENVLNHGINRQMPAFLRDKGGPLTKNQLIEVAKWLSGLDE